MATSATNSVALAVKRSAAAIRAHSAATASSAMTASQPNCLSTRIAEACGLSARAAATLKAVICSSVTGWLWWAANIARRASRWSTASMA